MQLIQLNVKVAIAGLWKVVGDITNAVSALTSAEGILTAYFGSDRLRNDGGRLQSDGRTWMELTLLQKLLSELDAIAPERRAAVKTEELILIFGGGILALDRLAAAVNGSRLNDADESMLAVRDFCDALFHLRNILQNDGIYLDHSVKQLPWAVHSITKKDGKVVKRLKGARPLTGHAAERNLTEVSDISTVLIPLGAKDLTATRSSYDFDQPDGAALPVYRTSSCEGIFYVPCCNNAIILQLFRYAIGRSKRFAGLKVASTLPEQRQRKAVDKLKALKGNQMKELCVDVYDELVRRNIKDENDGEALGGRPGTRMEPPIVMETSSERRNQARVRLTTLVDTRFYNLLVDVCGDLERRCQETGETAATALQRP
ncbi:hypothetical protein B0T14DRAFT_517003 [Immersiella caudata]|uniref:GIT Spa2 homology (SHD) domain-containing protein n=1 Tax=Immersiella caudata TaxID=314043 RepID=A0AA40C3T8_9PEZI|nr:hypothetical protein B0T14DRAFT_517003 [Immersiella caudata]